MEQQLIAPGAGFQGFSIRFVSDAFFPGTNKGGKELAFVHYLRDINIHQHYFVKQPIDNRSTSSGVISFSSPRLIYSSDAVENTSLASLHSK